MPVGDDLDERWRHALTDLADVTSQAWRERDAWTLLTAVSVGPAALEDARVVVEDILEAVDVDPSTRIVDLGSGIGRHAALLAEKGAMVTTIESSRRLGEIAGRLVPEAQHVIGSFHDIGGIGEFDLAFSFNESAMLASSVEGFAGCLRLIRGALRDFGVLVLEVADFRDEDRSLPGPSGLVVAESTSSTGPIQEHRFTFMLSNEQWNQSITGVTLSDAEIRGQAQESGFQLETTRRSRVGTSLYFLRAVRGYNFISDLPEFLDSWTNPDHPRNLRTVRLQTDSAGRRKPDQVTQEGSGVSLSRHHPDFESSIEQRVRPLVMELVGQWNFVSYSSCEGHPIDDGPYAFSECYCGIVVFSNEQASTIRRLVENFASRYPWIEWAPRVRQRTLLGVGCSFVAADILFERSRVPQHWDDYRNGIEESVSALVAHLVELRER